MKFETCVWRKLLDDTPLLLEGIQKKSSQKLFVILNVTLGTAYAFLYKLDNSRLLLRLRKIAIPTAFEQ